METGQGWYLVAIAGNLKGQEFPVTERRLSVGREDHNDLVLNDDNVSRRHLEIHEQDYKVMVADLGSRNGTFINNQRITGNVFLDEGDRLALGSHLLEVRHRGGRRRQAPLAEGMEPASLDLAEEEKTVVHVASNMVEWMPGQEGAPRHLSIPKAKPASPKARASKPRAPKPRPPKRTAPPPIRAPQSLLEMDDPPTYVPEAPVEEEEKTMILPEAPPPQAITPPASADLSAPLDLEEATMIHPTALGGGATPPAGGFAEGLQPSGFQSSEATFQPIGGIQAEMPMHLDPEPPPPPRRAEGAGARKSILIGGGAILFVSMIAAAVIGTQGPGSADSPAEAAPERGLALQEKAPERADDIASLLSGEGGGSLVVGPQAYNLEKAEANLPAEERRELAQEVFDQAVSYTNSERLKEALREFNHALALDGSCDICMIRANKVARALKERIEKYNNDGLRYFQALKYEQAYQSWERALLLLDDPSSPAGQRIQAKMVEARQQHANQSYR